MKENENLQATVNSLKSSRRSKPIATQDGDESSDAEESAERQRMTQELERLTNSMTELMQEKKLIQSAAIAERKTLKQDYEEKVNRLETDLEETSEEKKSLSQQLTEVK